MVRKNERTPIGVNNVTRGQAVVSKGRVADNRWTRMRGLIGSKPLAPGEGLLIVPCKSIHTHFMGFPIDVLYLNKELRVVGIDENIAPWRLGRKYRGTEFVVELPPGTASASGTQVGDQLNVVGYRKWSARTAKRSR